MPGLLEQQLPDTAKILYNWTTNSDHPSCRALTLNESAYCANQQYILLFWHNIPFYIHFPNEDCSKSVVRE